MSDQIDEINMREKTMENVGTLEMALERYSDYMKSVSYNVSRKSRGELQSDDIFQDLYIVLHKVYERFNAVPVVEFTKLFYSSINNFVCNMISTKRNRNNVKMYNVNNDRYTDSRSQVDKPICNEMTDESYKTAIIDVLNNISPDAGKAILDSFDPNKRGNSADGIKDAYQEVEKYLLG